MKRSLLAAAECAAVLIAAAPTASASAYTDADYWSFADRMERTLDFKWLPRGAGVHAIRAAAQSSQPNPGPTAAIQIARATRFRRTALTVRLTPVHNEPEAAVEAARLD